MSDLMLETPEEAAYEKTESYTKWAAKSEIKMMISLLPPLETALHRDCFATLLRCAFDAGCDLGEGRTAAKMLKAMLTNRDKHDRR